MTQASWARRRPEQTMYCEGDGLHASAMGMKLTSPRLFLDAALWWKCQLPAHHCSIRAWRGRAYLRICDNHRDVSLQALLTAAADTAAQARGDTSNTITHKGLQLQYLPRCCQRTSQLGCSQQSSSMELPITDKELISRYESICCNMLYTRCRNMPRNRIIGGVAFN